MDYAVVGNGGKQFRVQGGDTIEIDKIVGVAGDVVKFDNVLLVNSDGKLTIGTPTVKDMVISGKIVEQKKGVKVRVATFKSKVRERRIKGFRAQLTVVKIDPFGAEKPKIVEEKPRVAAKKKQTKKAS